MNRILLLIFAFFILNNNCSAQDTIVKMNGRKTICKVLEVTQIKVIYSDSRNIDQRTMDQIGISHIKYQDGTIDFFRSTTIDQTEYYDIKRSKNNLFKSGISLNIQPGYSYFSKFGGYNLPDRVKLNLVGLSIKLENRWFYGQKSNFRNGIQLSWFEFAGYFDSKNFTFYLGLVNPGYCGIFKLSEKSGLEYTLNVGFGLLGNYKPYTGINITPKLEYTMNNHSIGISYSTFVAGNQFTILGGGGYKRAVFHNFNLCYRIKF